MRVGVGSFPSCAELQNFGLRGFIPALVSPKVHINWKRWVTGADGREDSLHRDTTLCKVYSLDRYQLVFHR